MTEVTGFIGMIKILFMDIDGVLNDFSVKSIHEKNALLEDRIRWINYVVQQTNCKIVVISNWSQLMPFDELKKKLYSAGLYPNSIIDAIKTQIVKTIIVGVSKDEFIKNYVSSYNLTKYAIVDDTLKSDLLEESKMVRPLTKIGMTRKEAEKLIEILNIN